MRRVSRIVKEKIAPVAGILLLVLPLVSHAVPAYHAGQIASHAYILGANNHVSLNQAASMVQRRTGGRILSATTSQNQGQTIYLIKVLTPKGVVRVYRVDTQGNFR